MSRLPSDVKVTYDWRPYELDPTLPSPGVNKMQRYASRFGPRFGEMIEQMKERGRPYNIAFSYGGNVGNTVNSHRLVELSKTSRGGNGSHTDALINELFRRYFEQEGDISNNDVLVDVASKAGLPLSKEEVKTFLEGDELRKEVTDAIADARDAGISGVPHFIINGKYSISGAQEPETFLSIFSKLGIQPKA